MVSSCSSNTKLCYSQAIAHIFYLPFVGFMRSSYNRMYYPYEEVTSDQFIIAMIFCGVCIAVAFLSIGVAYLAIQARHNLNFITMSFPIVYSNQPFFVYVTAGALSMLTSFLLWQHQMYFLWLDKGPNYEIPILEDQ